uniref:Putative secreted protein n=1 Tax=Ixodes ricinus TaxID=34613 RepID=A0A6B0U393_IXORI
MLLSVCRRHLAHCCVSVALCQRSAWACQSVRERRLQRRCARPAPLLRGSAPRTSSPASSSYYRMRTAPNSTSTS